jgi:NitT/TauT family transport system ATP-binding protein
VRLYTLDDELVCIIGPSGVGKSTLLRILGGFIRPEKGFVRLLGEPVTKPTPRIAMIHQSIVTFPWLTALENVKLGLRYRRLSRDEEDRVARRMLELVGLQDYADFYPKQMSGGMRQRLAIARALAAEPLVLLMDEPFSHLDEWTAGELRREIYNILFGKETTLRSVVMVSHNLVEVVELADRVYVLNGLPATIVGEVRIDLERPRDVMSDKFREYVGILYKMIMPIRSRVSRG